MLKNYFLIAYRHMIRQRPYAIINILGLSIGIACALLIGIYVTYEFSFDKFNRNINRMYRVCMEASLSNINFSGPASPGQLAEVMLHDFPEVEQAARLITSNNRNITYQQISSFEDLFYYADPSITDIFTFAFIKGNKNALKSPKSIIITREIASKYFGDVNPLGKVLKVDHEDFTITGVTESFPANSHFHFNFIATTVGNPDFQNNPWIANFLYTYVLLRPGTDPAVIDKKFHKLFRKRLPVHVLDLLNRSSSNTYKQNNHLRYYLQKVIDIHLKSNKDLELESNGSMNYVHIFIIIAFFILINACINFTNLSTARSAIRAKEVGLRKAMGSSRLSLITQFMLESFFICSIAVLLSFLCVEICLPHLSALVDHPIVLSQKQLIHLYLLFPVLVVVIGFISGIYPAFYLSSFRPNDVIKKKFTFKGTGSYLRNTLVIVQYSVSIFILLGTLIVSSQLNFIQGKELGYDKENLLIIDKTNPITQHIKEFLIDVKRNPNVRAACLSGSVPGKLASENGYVIEGTTYKSPMLMSDFSVDDSYVATMGITMTSGRFFKSDFRQDSLNVVINEAAVHKIGVKNIIGQRLTRPGFDQKIQHFTVIGVVKDFNFESLYKSINPMILHPNTTYFPGYIILRIKSGRNQPAISQIQHIWRKYAIVAPMHYYFMNDDFNRLYKNELETQRIMSAFSIVSIFISMLGIFGLVSFLAERRTKEIGIRKVLGASVIKIVLLLSKNITILALISFLIASSAIYLSSGSWLNQFAYHCHVSVWIYITGGVVTLLITWITIGFQTILAALKNPADSLHIES